VYVHRVPRSLIIIVLLLLLASAGTGFVVASPSCMGMYQARSRAVPVEAKVAAVDQRVIQTRTSRRVAARTKKRTIEDLDVVATWQGRDISRTVSKKQSGAHVGDVRTILVDPEDPDLEIPEGPAWFNVVPGAIVSGGLAVAALWLVARHVKRSA
jgi:hypothetical protein